MNEKMQGYIKFIVIATVAIFCTMQIDAQVENGKTYITSSLIYFSVSKSKSVSSFDSNPDQISTVGGFNISPEIALGKMKNDRLISYGMNVSYALTKQDSDGKFKVFSVGPTVNYQKFYKIGENLFLSPLVRLRAVYSHGKSDSDPNTSDRIEKGLSSFFKLYPFSTTFKIGSKTMQIGPHQASKYLYLEK